MRWQNPVVVAALAAILALAAVVVATGRVGTRTAPRGSVGTAGSVAGEQGAAWVMSEGPGFSIEHRADWELKATGAEGSIGLTGPKGDELRVLPFFTARTLGDYEAGAVLADLGRKMLDADWSQPTVTDGAARMTAVDGSDSAVAIMTYTPATRGTAGYVFVAHSRSDDFAGASDDFGRMMASFVAKGHEVVEAPTPTYDTFTDPAENAFTLEVPRGWSARGGAERPSLLMVQASVNVDDPEGEASLFFGDTFPLYTEPNPSLELVGIGPGGTYTDPSGYASPVQYYAPGSKYFANYVLPQRAPGARIVRSQERPDIAGSLATLGINRFDAGEVEYRLRRDGRPYRGAALTITEFIEAQPGYAQWHVWRMLIAEAPEERFDEASAAAVHMVDSIRINPQWAKANSETVAAQSRIIAEMNDSVSDTITEGYWQREATYDALSQRRSDATLEIERVYDPVTDSKIEVESGAEYYWLDPQGNIVGTNTHTLPDVDFRELLTSPTD